MGLFKYMMNVLRTRLNAEWQDLHVQYPEWLTRIVMDEFYYVIALVVVCACCFAVGLIIGIVHTLV